MSSYRGQSGDPSGTIVAVIAVVLTAVSLSGNGISNGYVRGVLVWVASGGCSLEQTKSDVAACDNR